MLLISHISACATCFAGKVCGLVPATWGNSLGDHKLGARGRILATKVARRACTMQTIPIVLDDEKCPTKFKGDDETEEVPDAVPELEEAIG